MFLNTGDTAVTKQTKTPDLTEQSFSGEEGRQSINQMLDGKTMEKIEQGRELECSGEGGGHQRWRH